MLLLALLLACSGSEDPKESPNKETKTTTTVTTPEPSTPTEPASIERLLEAFDAEGLDANEGRISFDAAANCCDTSNCLHMNPGSEYGTWALPPNPDEYIDDRYPDDEGRILTWRLRADEAVLFVGKPPPGARYVSFRTYVHDVAAPATEDQEGPTARLQSFENLGDTLNNVAWKIHEDGTLLVLTTANLETLQRVETAAAEAGWPEVNVDGIPAESVNQGLSAESDTYHTTLRVVGFDDRPRFDLWAAEAEGRVFRITPQEVGDVAPLPEINNRALTQLEPLSAHDAAVDALGEAILAAHPGWTVVAPDLDQEDPPEQGTCWPGCNRDVSYTTSPDTLVSPTDRIIVYGVDPARFGRATWTAIVMHGQANHDAAGAFGTTDLEGSASVYMEGAEDLYAVTFSRDCTGVQHCVEVPSECPGIEMNELAVIAWRHYLDPASGTFPPGPSLGKRGIFKLTPPATTTTQ